MTTATADKPTTDTKPQPKRAEKKPLAREPGMFVLWYADADTGSGGYTALVLAVKGETLDLKVFRAGEDMVKTTVRHIGDEQLKTNGFVRRQYGGWGEHPVYEPIYELTR